MIDRLHVVGPARGTSGYDRHTRAFVEQFLALGVDLGFTQLEGWSPELPPDQRPAWTEGVGATVEAETVLHFTMPHHAQPLPGRRNVNYTMFEANGIPPDWVRRALEQDRVVLPTTACRDAWTASGVPEPHLRIAPLAVDAAHFARPAEPLALTTADGRGIDACAVRFLNVAEPRPRKNVLALLRVWIRATRPDDDAVLVLKPSLFHPAAFDQFAADVQTMQRTLGRSMHDAAPVVVLPAVLSEEQMRALYAAATHYVSLSHGEGWDQPMMEAAVAGLGLVAPRHTAYVEYLRDDEVEFVPTWPAPFRSEGRMGAEDELFFRGLSWWDPDEDAAVEIVRRIVDGRSEKASPGARLAAEYTWERSARKLLAALD